MAVEHIPTRHNPRLLDPSVDERIQLRAAVLRLGGLLGWQTQEVIAFAQAVTDRPWRRCGPADFKAVLEEYEALLQAIQDKAQRRAAGREQARLAEMEVQQGADCD